MSSGTETNQNLLVKSLGGAREGVIIVDALHPGFPIRYVNESFARLTGYSCGELTGKNYRLLHGTDTKQAEIAVTISAIAKGEGCTVTLRNYRKNGSMFRGEFSVVPLCNAQGLPIQFIGILRDLTGRGLAAHQEVSSASKDMLVRIGERDQFDQRFSDLLNVSQLIRSGISVLMVSLDHFKLFNERYGESAGNECLHMVASCIAKSFTRTSDCVARYGHEEFSVVSFFPDIDTLRLHAQRMSERVRALNIPHSDSPHGVVTICIGGVYCVPNRDTTEDMLIQLANQELLAAKHGGCDRVHITG